MLQYGWIKLDNFSHCRRGREGTRQLPPKFWIVKKVLVQFFSFKNTKLWAKIVYFEKFVGQNWTYEQTFHMSEICSCLLEKCKFLPPTHAATDFISKMGQGSFPPPRRPQCGSIKSTIPNEIRTSVSWDWTSAPRDCISVSKDSNSTPSRPLLLCL